MIETAKANGWNPFKYLALILKKAPSMKSADEWGKLLPGTSPCNFSGVSVKTSTSGQEGKMR
jgi:hypothetical protein